MALIKCKNCGREISDKAIECVYCKTQFKENEVNFKGEKETNSSKNTKSNVKNGSGVVILIIIVAIIFYFCYNHVSLSSGGGENDISSDSNDSSKVIDEKYAIRQIEHLIWNYDNEYVPLYTSHSIGKITSVNCSSSENEYDNNGRYLLRCSFKYNPSDGGATELNREYKGGVYAMFLSNGNGQFYYNFYIAGTAYKDNFKTKNCWGKSENLKLNCGN